MGGERTRPQRGTTQGIIGRAERVAERRHVLLAVSLTLLGVAFLGAVVMRIVDSQDFPTFGLALWWALQTFTTVGYGDVVPHSDVGRVVGGILMVVGVMFISFLTAAVTSSIVTRDRHTASETAATADLDAVVASLDRIEARLGALETRLQRDADD